MDNSDIWGGKWLAGDVRYKNLNGDKTADGKDIISKGHSKLQDPGDRKIIGNNTARYNYGISLSAEYKNFRLLLFDAGVGKRDLMLGGAYFWGFTDEWRTPTTEQLDYWTPGQPECLLSETTFRRRRKLPKPDQVFAERRLYAYEAINLRLQHRKHC